MAGLFEDYTESTGRLTSQWAAVIALALLWMGCRFLSWLANLRREASRAQQGASDTGEGRMETEQVTSRDDRERVLKLERACDVLRFGLLLLLTSTAFTSLPLINPILNVDLDAHANEVQPTSTRHVSVSRNEDRDDPSDSNENKGAYISSATSCSTCQAEVSPIWFALEVFATDLTTLEVARVVIVTLSQPLILVALILAGRQWVYFRMDDECA
ncbi:hypothetical protein HDU67_002994 [Dinochytrium kinnereticum]|nr:hypothetical protein HDU67_002994 [Dinochytrium kinnereticum]